MALPLRNLWSVQHLPAFLRTPVRGTAQWEKGSMIQFFLLASAKGRILHDLDIPFPGSALGCHNAEMSKPNWHKALQMVVQTKGFSPLLLCRWKL